MGEGGNGRKCWCAGRRQQRLRRRCTQARVLRRGGASWGRPGAQVGGGTKHPFRRQSRRQLRRAGPQARARPGAGPWAPGARAAAASALPGLHAGACSSRPGSGTYLEAPPFSILLLQLCPPSSTLLFKQGYQSPLCQVAIGMRASFTECQALSLELGGPGYPHEA